MSQLGTTVAVGVIAAASLMIHFYARDLTRTPSRFSIAGPGFSPAGLRRLLLAGRTSAAVLILLAVVTLALRGWPGWAADTQALRPKDSMAYPALDRLTEALGGSDRTLSVLVEGKSAAEVSGKLTAVRARLDRAVGEGVFSRVDLPGFLWPRADFQSVNLAAAAPVAETTEALRKVILGAGFSESAVYLTSDILKQWGQWEGTGVPIWPDGEAFRWIARRTISHGTPDLVVCGLAVESPGTPEALVDSLAAELSREGVYLTAWRKLGGALARHSMSHGLLAASGFAVALVIALAFSFRNVADVLLALGTTLVSLVVLCGAMRLLSLEWNFMNLCSLSLTIGMGVDYSIHMIFSLREYRGNIEAVYNETGKALGLCAATTIAGFASLAAAQTEGLAALGANCAIGIAASALCAVFLLPACWRLVHGRKPLQDLSP